MADAQQEQAKALHEISRNVKRMVQVFEVMNSNLVEIFRILRPEQTSANPDQETLPWPSESTLLETDKNGD